MKVSDKQKPMPKGLLQEPLPCAENEQDLFTRVFSLDQHLEKSYMESVISIILLLILVLFLVCYRYPYQIIQ